MFYPEQVGDILLTEQQIKERVKALGAEITRDYKGKIPMMLCVLKGATVFFSDLIREIETEVQIEFIRASSYVGEQSSGQVTLDVRDLPDVSGRDVIIVEDIVDTARTLSLLTERISHMSPASLKVAVLLDKPSRRVVEGFKADYTGFEIDDFFVVGYGLDCDQRFRNLPYIGIFKT